jgi:DNA-binding NarL/FixJ family response regulator
MESLTPSEESIREIISQGMAQETIAKALDDYRASKT